MTEATQVLSELARIDARLLELNRQLRKIPDRLTSERKSLDLEQKVLDEIMGPWQQLESDISKRESTIALAVETIAKFEEHMKRVTTQKDYMADRKQIEDAHKLNDQLQREIAEARQTMDEFSPRLKEVRGRYDRVLEEYQGREAVALGEKAVLDAELAQAQKRFNTLAAERGPQFMAYYRRLYKAGRQPAIVPVVAGTCTGCRVALPPQAYNNLIANPSQHGTCSHCSRIVFYQAPEHAEPIARGDSPAA